MKIILAVCVPVIIFGFWGLVDFHKAGKFSELFRLLQELLISAAAAFALYIAGQHALGWILAVDCSSYYRLFNGRYIIKVIYS